MRKKQLCSIALTASILISATSCGLYQSSDIATKETSIISENTSADISTEETKEKVTLHHGGSETSGSNSAESAQGSSETDVKETTSSEGENLSPEEGTAKKYLGLMKMSREEAINYFEATVDENLTSENFDAFLENLFSKYLGNNVFFIKNYYSSIEATGIAEADLDFSLVSASEKTTLVDSKNSLIEDLKEMLSYPYDSLTDRQKLVYDKFYYEYIIGIWSYDITTYSSTVSAMRGLISNISVAFYEFTFTNEKEIQYYLKAMESLPEAIDYVFDSVMKDINEKEYYPTDYMLDSTMETIKELINLEDNPFIYAFNEKVDLVLEGEKAEEYKETNKKFYTEKVVPALNTLYDNLSKLVGKNPEGKGLCDYPGGLEYYKLLVEDAVGSLMPLEDVADLLEADLTSEIKIENLAMLDDYFGVLNYYSGNYSFGEIENLSPAEMIEKLKKDLKEDYPSIDSVEYKVSKLPESLRVDSVMAYYNLPTLDSEKINVIRYNPDSLGENILLTYQTLAHEGYPGHMLQYNLMNGDKAYKIEHLITHLGYTEGWAMYVENSAVDDVFGDDSSLGSLVKADSHLNYDIYAICDIGFNGLSWSIKDAINYFDKYELNLDESTINAIRNIVISDPAAYLSYSVGYIIVEDILNQYKTDHSAIDTHKLYCEIGPASFNVVKKYMGLE